MDKYIEQFEINNKVKIIILVAIKMYRSPLF